MTSITDSRQIAEIISVHAVDSYFDASRVPFDLRCYSQGEIIQNPENVGSHLAIIVSGEVQVYTLNENGKHTPVALLNEGMLMGDLEYCGYLIPFFAEAATSVMCVVLDIKKTRPMLNDDVRFLHALVDSIAQKFSFSTNLDFSSASLEDRIMFYLRTSDEHCIKSVSKSMYHLHTSRRTLQRALHNLCESGRIVHTKKGCYHLAGAEYTHE